MHRFDAWIPAEQEECWSRMLYIVEQQRRLALISGDGEVGKSWLLNVLINLAQRTAGRVLRLVDASGLSQDEFSQQLAAACGEPGDSWSAIEDWLWGAAAGGIHAVWIIDHFDQAGDDLGPAVRRLVRLTERTRAASTMIIAGRRWSELSTLSDLADLSCEVPAWSLETTMTFLERSVQPDTHGRPALTPAAMQGVYDCTLGVAGRVRRLCELCLIAAELREETLIQVDLVLDVWRELLNPQIPERRHLQC